MFIRRSIKGDGVNIEHQSVIVQKAAAIATGTTYTISTGLVTGSFMDFLNNNAGAIGVGIGLATFAVNWYYRHKDSKKAKSCEPS